MYLCDVAGCTAEFPQTPSGKEEWLLHRARHKSPMGTPGDTATGEKIRSMSASEIKAMKVEDKKNVKPLKLVYHWEGGCPDCGNFVETLDVDAGQEKGKTVVIAYCSSCKKQLVYRPVTKL